MRCLQSRTYDLRSAAEYARLPLSPEDREFVRQMNAAIPVPNRSFTFQRKKPAYLPELERRKERLAHLERSLRLDRLAEIMLSDRIRKWKRLGELDRKASALKRRRA